MTQALGRGMRDEIEPYADEIGNFLVRLQRVRERTIAHAKSTDGIDPAAYGCLFRLLKDGPMRSGALAESMYTDPSTVSRQVAQLVERGHVQRQADPTDGRASVLAVTESGRAAAGRIRALRNERLGMMLDEWSIEDLQDFARLMDRFVTDYERMRPLFTPERSLPSESVAERSLRSDSDAERGVR
ncbi:MULTISPECIES: MarR family winged helix-turn-helix transcriptional regulator [unclassified Rhodococcus (in: high G+C Gram-positive bacteria)]|uniref:MarR family winged helix-turn-helix transcriptional regulator n=1 Tax=unclassified Rhodococcus (in: high G+C Gram-positive bacteria) TaxID=192944 RepID=UPI001B44DB2C|nr:MULTISPECIES: MarR family transcriptional regulator [unclassified Rhodococcus (in: high G+C Gram-positive bacteria)]MBP1160908.1 DNA-binding MarR family transcriptional regulator [Rhodococcus sp. PvR099]